VITPGDAAYEQARSVVDGGIDRRPAVIVWAADATEVAQVVGSRATAGWS
jgi:predicted AAA+ superfamily ATPase